MTAILWCVTGLIKKGKKRKKVGGNMIIKGKKRIKQYEYSWTISYTAPWSTMLARSCISKAITHIKNIDKRYDTARKRVVIT